MIKPTYYYQSVSEININDLVSINKKYCLIDMDNTLSIFNEEKLTKDAEKFIKDLSNAGIESIIISNNSNKRVIKALEGFNVLVLSRALKPFKTKTNIFLKKHGLKVEDCILIGDQLYTDIRLANNAKIDSILVEPLVNNDKFVTWFNRSLDLKLRKKLKEKGLLKKIHE